MKYSLVGLLLIFLAQTTRADDAQEFIAVSESLAPRYLPADIQANARQGKFLKTTLSTEPVSAKVFDGMVKKTIAEGSTAFAIGVIVDSGTEAWPSDGLTAHIRDVWRTTVRLVNGERAEGHIGFAEQYGGRVQVVLPIEYVPGQKLYFTRKGEVIEISLDVGDIIIAVNDHLYALDENDQLINSTTDLRSEIEKFMGLGRFLVTRSEFREQSQSWLAAFNKNIQGQKADIAKHDIIITSIEGQIVEGLLLLELLDSKSFDPSTSEGRENRKVLQTYFERNELPMDKQRYDAAEMLDTYHRFAVGMYQQACDLDHAESCNALSLLYQTGESVAMDLQRAMSLRERACELGLAPACGRFPE